jgi:phosphoribosylaminoimidazole-succinocarboxamide synthase
VKLFYEGKAKRVYGTENLNEVEIEFKNSLTAFNALKKGEFDQKGAVNLSISEILFAQLEKAKIKTHFVRKISENRIRALQVQIIPLEVVVRNRIAGSLAKKMGLEEGGELPFPVVEFYYKSDELQDPFLNDDQIYALKLADQNEVSNLKKQVLEINKVLKPLFQNIGIALVDFKVEFGKTPAGEIILADEISPDCARLWDLKSGEKMDKDRFRRDLGQVKEMYEEVLRRLKTV